MSFAAAPRVVEETLKLPNGGRTAAGFAFLSALTAFLALLVAGCVARWRWLFWLVLLAFLAGLLRVPAGILQLVGLVAASAPAWYIWLQILVGIVQFAIGLAMLRGYRRAGPWGRF